MENLLKDELIPLLKAEQSKCADLGAWLTPGKCPKPFVKSSAKPEHRLLAALAVTPWLELVVTTLAQALSVKGYRSENGTEGAWTRWTSNRLGLRQQALYREASAFGQAFATVLPGQDSRSVVRFWSPKRLVAVYEDPVNDDFPVYALAQVGENYLFIDAEASHKIAAEGSRFHSYESTPHNLGVCPVIRYANEMDLCGNVIGEIERFIPLAERKNKTTYDRLLTQHYNSWKVKTVTGLDLPETQADQAHMEMKLSQSDILVAEDPDARWNSLPETPLDGFIAAHDADLQTLSAVTQTPLHAFTGSIANLSPEAITAMRSAFVQKVAARKESFGASHGQLLRLAAWAEGDEAGAADFGGNVVWESREVVSLAQIADASSKLSPIGVPIDYLLGMLPGVTDTEAQEWSSASVEVEQ